MKVFRKYDMLFYFLSPTSTKRRKQLERSKQLSVFQLYKRTVQNNGILPHAVPLEAWYETDIQYPNGSYKRTVDTYKPGTRTRCDFEASLNRARGNGKDIRKHGAMVLELRYLTRAIHPQQQIGRAEPAIRWCCRSIAPWRFQRLLLVTTILICYYFYDATNVVGMFCLEEYFYYLP